VSDPSDPSGTALRCPTCKKPLEGRPDAFPFCSQRCRDVDLGQWFLGKYAISRPIGLDDLDEDLPEAQPDGDE